MPASPESAENAPDLGGPATSERGRGGRAGGMLRRAGKWWADARDAARADQMPSRPVVTVPVERFDRQTKDERRVPRGVQVASEWVWRLLIIAAGVLACLWLLIRLKQIVIPIVVALLLTALLFPVYRQVRKVMRPLLASGVTVLGLLLAVSGALYLVGAQFASQFDEISAQIASGIGDLRTWLITTFDLSDSQLDDYLERGQEALTNLDLQGIATTAGVTIGQIIVGVVLALVILFFFLGRGEMFYAWFVRMLPRHARVKALVSGNIAWGQMAQYTRATVVVASVDGAGIGLGAWALGVPFPLGIAVLTFLGAFVPIVGAFTAGAVAVLLAFVSNGVVNALLMLGVVVLVQQIEGNVLHPVLMGRAVRVHPLGIIIAVTAGIQLAGIVGAVIAVPIAAMVNAVAHYLLQPDPERFETPADLITEEQAAQVRRETARARRIELGNPDDWVPVPPVAGSAAAESGDELGAEPGSEYEQPRLQADDADRVSHGHAGEEPEEPRREP